MSSDSQIDGDSYRRQLENARAYAFQNQLTLADDCVIEDLGISAFTGANVEVGNLGKFLDRVRRGEVEQGSYLLVEAFDRISRQIPLKSLQIFVEIISSGINLITVADGRRYSANTGIGELIGTLIYIGTSYDESVKKSQRVREAWEKKRRRASVERMSRRCPKWLKPSTTAGVFFEPIEARVEVVRRIFRESANGLGQHLIARRLNDDGISSFGRANKDSGEYWGSSSVSKILSNRAVFGEFQPHKLVDKRRVPDGPAISGYFPAIIESDLFFRVQAGRALRRRGGGGRRGHFISNLVSGLAKCAYCGASMRYVNKGKPPKGGSYLVCSEAITKTGCPRRGWRYRDFEASLLYFVAEVDLISLFGNGKLDQERLDVDDKLQSLMGQRDTLILERDRLFSIITEARESAIFLAAKFDEFERKLDELEKTRIILEEEKKKLSARLLVLAERDTLNELIQRLAELVPENVEIRAGIAGRLKSLIARIDVAPSGNIPNRLRLKKFCKDLNVDEEVTQHLGDTHSELDTCKYFSVVFSNGDTRIVYVEDDPLEFVQVIDHDGGRIGRTYRSDGEVQKKMIASHL